MNRNSGASAIAIALIIAGFLLAIILLGVIGGSGNKGGSDSTSGRQQSNGDVPLWAGFH